MPHAPQLLVSVLMSVPPTHAPQLPFPSQVIVPVHRHFCVLPGLQLRHLFATQTCEAAQVPQGTLMPQLFVTLPQLKPEHVVDGGSGWQQALW